MRKTLLRWLTWTLAAAMVATAGFAAAQSISGYTSPVQDHTAGRLPSGTSDGVNLFPSGGYKLSAQAADTRCAFASGGALLAWTYSNQVGAWVREPTLDVAIPVNDAGVPPAAYAITIVQRGRSSMPQSGRIYYQVSGTSLVWNSSDGGTCADAGVYAVLEGMDQPTGPSQAYP